MPKQKYNFRLSDDAKELLKLLAKKTGITQTSVIELAIRAYAQQIGIEQVDPTPAALPRPRR